jgi:hypothetical protein
MGTNQRGRSSWFNDHTATGYTTFEQFGMAITTLVASNLLCKVGSQDSSALGLQESIAAVLSFVTSL